MVRGGPGTKKSTTDYKKIRILIYSYYNQNNPIIKYTLMTLPSNSGWNISNVDCTKLLNDLILDKLLCVDKIKKGRKKYLEFYKITEKGKDFVQLIEEFNKLEIKSFEIFKAIEEPKEYTI